MVTTIQYVNLVWIISVGFKLFTQCQCSSANHTDNFAMQARKIISDDESITGYTNLISEPNSLLLNEQQQPQQQHQITNNDYQFYNEPATVAITPKYEPTKYLSNHQSLNPLDINQTYFPQMHTTPYIPNNNYMVQETPPPMQKHHYVRVTKSPTAWTQNIINMPLLESQYMASFRNLKSTVMNIFYKMQDLMGYMMSFFKVENTSVGESRGKKLKVKKKYKKFLLPLLIAYKLKFFALIPMLVGGLILLIGSTGMAGFFFALFTAVISLKGRKE